MNVWTGIALANLQRRRGPPLDYDLETLEPAKTTVCDTCDQPKSESDFYLKLDRAKKEYRLKTCRECICKRDRAKRAEKASTKPPRIKDMVYAAIDGRELTLREISKEINKARRTADRIVNELIAEGLAEKGGMKNRHGLRVQAYRRTQTQN